MFDILWGETGGTRSVRTVEEEELKDDDEEEKNRITGPAAYLVPGLMLLPKFGSTLTGGSGEEEFPQNWLSRPFWHTSGHMISMTFAI